MSDQDDKQLPLFQAEQDNLVQEVHDELILSEKETPFSKYIVYVDESGDHSFEKY